MVAYRGEEVPRPTTSVIDPAPKFEALLVNSAAAAPVWLQFMALGVIVNQAFSAIHVITVLLTSSMLRRVPDRALGARLAVSER